MNIYIIKHKTGQIMSVNRTILGCSMELYGLDIKSIGGLEASCESLQTALATSPHVECLDNNGQAYIAERHFVSN